MKPFNMMIAGAVLAMAAPSAAQAATLVVDVAGSQSAAGFGGAGNTVLTFNIGAGSTITNLAYDVTVTAFSPSWLSEASIAFTGSNDDGVFLRVAPGETLSGTASFSEAFDLVEEGFAFAVGTDGILRIEFFETFDDSAVDPDAIWDRGTITLDYTPGAIPEPATWAMMIGGFGLVGGAMRRRGTAGHAAA